MYPVICTIGPFTVYSYGLMLALAVVIASSLAAGRAKQEGINPEIVLNLSFIGVISGVIGARAFYVVENFAYYLENPLEALMLQHGGLSWFGGLALGSASAVIYLKKKRLPIYKALDLIAPFIALAQSLGRVGCLLNGCCFGYTFIPLQIYSSLSLVALFLFLRHLQERPQKQGRVFFTYLLLYSLGRFFIEFWRAEHRIILWGFTLFQLICVALFIVAALKLIFIRKTK